MQQINYLLDLSLRSRIFLVEHLSQLLDIFLLSSVFEKQIELYIQAKDNTLYTQAKDISHILLLISQTQNYIHISVRILLSVWRFINLLILS
ncbi:hypothetical protein RchiOBHm_Chr6g0287121 [Rosa chinensis]|uniref:Uncharacterized protein n=1 Tax=Rosa chinensis TaxID=74649 RepID=A0A2P6PV27_ROSCH|nr:hypothetical protein RchiOBHm_Chr6g0287121 [Rosa chinensis]